MFEQIVQLGMEGRIDLRGAIFALKIEDERHQRLGDVAAAKFPEMSVSVGLGA